MESSIVQHIYTIEVEEGALEEWEREKTKKHLNIKKMNAWRCLDEIIMNKGVRWELFCNQPKWNDD